MTVHRNLLMGVGAGLLAGALWGLVFIAPSLTPGFAAPQIAAARYMAYGALALPLLLPRWRGLWRKLSRADWLALAWLGLTGNGLWNSASRRLPLTMTGQLVVFETVFALIYSFAYEDRWPTFLEAGAIAALLGGVWWCAASHRIDHPAHD